MKRATLFALAGAALVALFTGAVTLFALKVCEASTGKQCHIIIKEK